MKYVVAAVALLLALVPGVSFGSHIPPTFFPDQTAMAVSTASEVNGVDHLVLQSNFNTLNLHAVFLDPTGTPAFARFPLPWVFGQLIGFQQAGSRVTLTWAISASTGGTNPTFVPLGTLTLVVNL